jgi:arginase
MAFKDIQIIGVPSDLGANMRGANMAPAAIRIAELHQKINVLGFKVHDRGDLTVPIRDTLSAESVRLKHLEEIRSICDTLADEVYASLKSARLPIVLGGDHSIAMGTISGVSRFYREKKQAMGLIWVDAHADMNTHDTSPSGNLHGMPLSVILGKGDERLTKIKGFSPKVAPENVALVGIRTLDGLEKEACKQSGVRYFTMREIDERGMHAVMKEAIEVAGRNTGGIHVSFDIDGIDPLYAPGVSTPVTGGISYREAHLALEMLADTGKLNSMEFVELNPMTDLVHKTAQLTVELIQSALGKSIV